MMSWCNCCEQATDVNLFYRFTCDLCKVTTDCPVGETPPNWLSVSWKGKSLELCETCATTRNGREIIQTWETPP
jgi:hypothetical protein